MASDLSNRPHPKHLSLHSISEFVDRHHLSADTDRQDCIVRHAQRLRVLGLYAWVSSQCSETIPWQTCLIDLHLDTVPCRYERKCRWNESTLAALLVARIVVRSVSHHVKILTLFLTRNRI